MLSCTKSKYTSQERFINLIIVIGRNVDAIEILELTRKQI